MKKIAIFADVQNIYYTTRDTYQRSFNYRAFIERLKETYTIEYAYAYAIDKGDSQQIKFQNALRHIGFEVKLKPFIQRQDGTAKGDWDVGITIDMLDKAPDVDEVLLLSGDGDFSILLDTVNKKYGCRTSVYGVLNLTSNTLINSASEFVEIDPKWLL
ncbi:NYN domain-containing protein [Alteromonas sp. 5E99-2]|uniref:LabA-like NYN domain-containing protein n=1 Tax=Alteromonas sp. 5E99-2 TaxID=2817683 RepID=UPI001A9888B3|nr:NYN domain-containing protein [Alteromonas sp. 5E99-2]MBO1254719.1 NYN domain-containing protein [Alteromonas sp. 5E99-2]